jgi:5'-nucleotidase
MTTTIFLDLDGVMFDFERHYEELFGHYCHSVSDDQMWTNIHKHPTFFLDLPIFPGATELFRELNSYRVGYPIDLIVCTACPRTDYQRIALQKKEAFAREFSNDVHVLPMRGGKNKFLFAKAKGDILIDDFEKNILPWREHVGPGIIHKNADDTMSEISKLIVDKYW